MIIFKWKIQNQKKLAKVSNYIVENNDVTEGTVVAHKYMLDSALGSILVMCGYFGFGAATVFFLTDIPVGDFSPCNLAEGYPVAAESGLAISLISLTCMVAYSMQNYFALGVFSFRVEVWLQVANVLMSSSIVSVYFLTVQNLDKTTGELLQDHVTLITFMGIITLNMCTRCIIPALYYKYYYKQRSIVDDKIREQFAIAEKQPFSMKKLIDHAGKELEIDSLVLYNTIRCIIEQRKGTEDTFHRCERLATLVFDNFIRGEQKTLDFYGLRNLVNGVKSSIELLEKEVTVLTELHNSIRERIILPMFARMVRQSPAEKRVDNI
jgi:hypothetical protein